MGQSETSSEPDEDRVKKAYGEWKEGDSLRNLEAKYGVSKSKLSRLFKGIRKVEDEEAKAKVALPPTDEELETLRKEVEAAKQDEELASAKYRARLERDQHRSEASRHQQMLEEYEALSDPEKMNAFIEKVLAQHPARFSELKQRLQRIGLTLEKGLRDVLEITAGDYKFCKEIYLKYTASPGPSLAEHILSRVDSWLKEQRLEERKVKLKPWIESHYPVCPECGRKCLEGTDSGDVACLLRPICKWTGRISCPICGNLMQYSELYRALECTNDYCRQRWRLYDPLREYVEDTS